MSEQRRHGELTQALIVTLNEARGKWVVCQSAAPAMSCVGRVVALDADSGVVVVQGAAGSARTTAVSLFVAVEVFGPAEQLRLNEALAEELDSAAKVIQ